MGLRDRTRRAGRAVLSRRAMATLLGGPALALALGFVATADESADHSPALARQLASARLATSKYATSLGRAQTDGYTIITRMIPDMGFHYMNPAIQGFDVRRPPILVYERKRGGWQLAALEWVFPKKPSTPPLPGATYGSFPAACHYADGTFVPTPVQDRCPHTSPKTGATFGFWHADLVTMHVWLWYPNPDGLFASYNPLIKPFNKG